MSVIENHKS